MTQEHDSYFQYLRARSRLGAIYRQHWLYPRLAKRLVGRTLDVGCGIGDMLAYRRGTKGVDINARTVEFCRSIGLDARQMDVDRLPFDAHSFDSVLLDNVMEHIANPTPLLSETHRVLVPGGRLLVGVPGKRGWTSDVDHKIYYDEPSLLARVTNHGFESTETFYTPLFKSAWLDRRMRQYCVYALFVRGN